MLQYSYTLSPSALLVLFLQTYCSSSPPHPDRERSELLLLSNAGVATGDTQLPLAPYVTRLALGRTHPLVRPQVPYCP